MKKNSNQETLASYELGAQEYIDHTSHEISPLVKTWIDETLALLPSQAKILEIGSAFGRDADYIESLGYKVERTDATRAFVTVLQKKGHAARLFNVLTDPLTPCYDLVFANAVFLHFTPQELKTVLQKIYAALTKDGLLAFTVKHGHGEEWTNAKLGHPRYFCYWKEEDIVSLLNQNRFDPLRVSKDDKFYQLIGRKT